MYAGFARRLQRCTHASYTGIRGSSPLRPLAYRCGTKQRDPPQKNQKTTGLGGGRCWFLIRAGFEFDGLADPESYTTYAGKKWCPKTTGRHVCSAKLTNGRHPHLPPWSSSCLRLTARAQNTKHLHSAPRAFDQRIAALRAKVIHLLFNETVPRQQW